MNTKQCNACGEIKTLADFNKDSNTQSGYESRCRICKKQGRRVNREISKANRKRKYVSGQPRVCRTCGFEKQADEFPMDVFDGKYIQVKSQCRLCVSFYNRLKTYNITQEDFFTMFREQSGKCAICEVQFTDTKKPVIDHCHNKNVVRGLLCYGCNRTISLFENDISFLKTVEAYLTHDYSDSFKMN
jgi:hypothetical protein